MNQRHLTAGIALGAATLSLVACTSHTDVSGRLVPGGSTHASIRPIETRHAADPSAASTSSRPVTPSSPTPSSSMPSARTGTGQPVVATSQTSAAGGTSYRTDTNKPLGFSVQLPDSYIEKAPPVDGDGDGFRSPDGRVSVEVFRYNNVLNYSVSKTLDGVEEDNAHDGASVTYANVFPHSFVYDGSTPSGKIISVTGIVNEQYVYELEWVYPRVEKDQAAATVRHSVSSFRAGSEEIGR